jgi:diacylglycerol kinase
MKSFQYALHGLLAALRSEKNLRLHVACAVLVTAAGIFLKITATEWMIVIFCISSVMAAELFNTALEKLCDVFTKEKHPKIKIIKDMSAAAVLMISLAAAVAGFIILIPKFITLFHSL